MILRNLAAVLILLALQSPVSAQTASTRLYLPLILAGRPQIPNDPPALESVQIAPNPVAPDGLLSVRAVYSDPQGAGDVQHMYLGFTPCTASSYELGVNAFEHNLASFIGLFGIAPDYGETVWMARHVQGGDCASIAPQQLVWGEDAPQRNAFGSAVLRAASYQRDGEHLTLQLELQLKGFPEGSYSLYAAVMDAQGIYHNNQRSGFWTKTAHRLVVSGPGTALAALNAYRGLANLPPLGSNPVWEQGNRLHARYAVRNDYLGHQEDPARPYYSLEGASAAQSSLLLAAAEAGFPDWAAVDLWMSGPLHALHILDPFLAQVGYGAHRENDGVTAPDGGTGFQAAAGLDVFRGLEPFASPVFPVFYPADGKTIPVDAYPGGETPDPLSPCPGYSAPSGPPILLMLGDTAPGGLPAASLRREGTAVPFCVYSAATYTHPDPAEQALGRTILARRGALVVVPRSPLQRGAHYAVSILLDGRAYSWTFQVSADAARPPAVPFLAPAGLP